MKNICKISVLFILMTGILSPCYGVDVRNDSSGSNNYDESEWILSDFLVNPEQESVTNTEVSTLYSSTDTEDRSWILDNLVPDPDNNTVLQEFEADSWFLPWEETMTQESTEEDAAWIIPDITDTTQSTVPIIEPSLPVDEPVVIEVPYVPSSSIASPEPIVISEPSAEMDDASVWIIDSLVSDETLINTVESGGWVMPDLLDSEPVKENDTDLVLPEIVEVPVASSDPDLVDSNIVSESANFEGYIIPDIVVDSEVVVVDQGNDSQGSLQIDPIVSSPIVDVVPSVVKVPKSQVITNEIVYTAPKRKISPVPTNIVKVLEPKYVSKNDYAKASFSKYFQADLLADFEKVREISGGSDSIRVKNTYLMSWEWIDDDINEYRLYEVKIRILDIILFVLLLVSCLALISHYRMPIARLILHFRFLVN